MDYAWFHPSQKAEPELQSMNSSLYLPAGSNCNSVIVLLNMRGMHEYFEQTSFRRASISVLYLISDKYFLFDSECLTDESNSKSILLYLALSRK